MKKFPSLHYYIEDISTEFDLILSLPFIYTLSPEVYKVEFDKWKLEPIPRKRSNLTRILVITEKLFGFGEDNGQYYVKIQLLSETINSAALPKLFKQFQGIFTESFKSLASERNIEHTIQLIDNSIFHKKSVFTLSKKKKMCMKMLINEILDIGLIRESKIHITANEFLFSKKTGGYRLCIGYLEFNKQTVKKNYRMPRIEELHDRLL